MNTINTVKEIKTVDLLSFICGLQIVDNKWSTNNEYEIIKQRGRFYLYIYTKRYTMDSDGYHIGYEKYIGRMLIMKREELGITGLPSFFDYVVIPDSLDLIKNIGATRSSAKYYKASDDFALGELQRIVELTIKYLPPAEFNPNTRTWTIGEWEFSLDDPIITKDVPLLKRGY